jgi:hypothetical protein
MDRRWSHATKTVDPSKRAAPAAAQADLAASLVATIRTNEISLDDLHRHQHSLTYPDRAISRPAPRFRSP